MRKGPGRRSFAVIPHYILWNIKWLAHFLGANPATRQGWGGREITARTRAHLKKNGAATIGVCSGVGRPWRWLGGYPLRGLPLVSQGHSPLAGAYPQINPHLTLVAAPLHPRNQVLRAVRNIAATDKRTVECGKNVADPGMKLVTSRRSTDPMTYRARRMPRLEIRPSGRTLWGYFSSARKGGRGGAGPDPYTNHSRNFRLEDPPQFFGQIFWEKILEIKILAPLVTIFLATHAATPPATAPSLAQHISHARHEQLGCQVDENFSGR
jgi:hypothetical protein